MRVVVINYQFSLSTSFGFYADDCEEVEQLTKEVIKTIEKICGETLQF